MEAPHLKQGLGYTTESVHVVLADRDKVAEEASEQARAADMLVLELRSDVERLRTELAERAEQIRALEAEAVELRTERDGARRDLEEAVTEAARLRLELLASMTTMRDMETMQHDPSPSQPEIETAREGPDEVAVLRQELGAARRNFVIKSQRARDAEARIEELEDEVRSVRAELEAGLSAATVQLEAARAAVERAAGGHLPEGLAATEEPSAVAEAVEPATDTILVPGGGRTAQVVTEAERIRRDDTAEVVRSAGSAHSPAPLVGEAQSATESPGRGAGIGDSVGEAVAPLAQAISELSDRLGSLGGRAAPSRDGRPAGTDTGPE